MMSVEFFDLFWGSMPGVFGLPLLFGSFVVVPFSFMMMGGLFMAPGRIEGAVEGGMRRFHSYISVEHNEAHSYGGYSHFMFALFSMIFTMNFLGCIAYYPALAIHWKMWISLSFPCWLAALVYTWPSNISTFFANMVPADQPLYVSFLLVLSEIMSILARPVTLALRIFVNMVIGQLFLDFFASGLVVALFKSLGLKSLLSIVVFGFFGFGFTLIELCVVVVQSSIFVKLLFIYSSENAFDSTAIKPKHASKG
uniref:ATP synthase F0 subunit 6 n=1 Tax=Nototeredo knoxi TaxID=2939324 RepID=UPI00202799FB|nr:ATP synthase F0 subunit 6 [Nototeredo knoxi]UPX89284.1 ATP synthase F0 subunit 6 [Nototeredo knoxi]